MRFRGRSVSLGRFADTCMCSVFCRTQYSTLILPSGIHYNGDAALTAAVASAPPRAHEWLSPWFEFLRDELQQVSELARSHGVVLISLVRSNTVSQSVCVSKCFPQ